jgi:hypothetical protein
VPHMPAFVTTVRAVAHPRGARWPAWRIVLARLGVSGIGVFLLLGGGEAAAQVPPPESLAHPHVEGQGHDGLAGPGVTGGGSSDAPVRYFLLNVEISDDGIQPSTVFVPAGRPVRLVLRNRGLTEHHYRVVGLVPDELSWIAAPPSTIAEGVSEDEHNHHDIQFVRSRVASPAGIRPTGEEVHAYVSRMNVVDVVLFSATQTGRFVVQCDLHPEKVGKLVVFGGTGQPAAPGNAPRLTENAPSIAPGSALSGEGGDPLSRALGDQLSAELSRDLGSVDYPGAARVFMEATYAPADYETLILGEPAAMAELDPDRYVAVLLTEAVHTGELPASTPPDLYLGGSPLSLIDSKVTTDLPHQRATFYRFARDDAFAAGDQVMTLRLASGQEATWDFSSSGGWNWLVPGIFAGGLGLFAWLVWMMAVGGAGRSDRMDPETQ